MATTLKLKAPPISEHVDAVHKLWGYGAQFDTAIFTRKGQPHGITAQDEERLEEAVKHLQPGHSRIFVPKVARRNTPEGKAERKALMQAVGLAQAGGANVNLTWWQGPYPVDAQKRKRVMDDFAGIVEEARSKHPCVTHLTIQNEVNSVDIAHQGTPRKSQELYKRLYLDLAASLEARRDPRNPSKTLRSAVRLVGGDLVDGRNFGPKRASQDAWLEFMDGDDDLQRLLHGYSIHVYWPQGNFGRLEGRLNRLLDIIRRLKIDKPIYITEYGVKATDAGKPGEIDGQNVEHMLETAFEHAWFNALAPQLGCVGFVKWALYATDGRTFGDWGMVMAPKKRFERTMTYRVMRLFSHLVERDWTASGFARTTDALTSAFSGPNGEHAVVTLNAGPRQDVRLEQLKPNARYFRAVWNREGEGGLHDLDPVTTDSGRTIPLSVPGRGVVALSTRPLQL